MGGEPDEVAWVEPDGMAVIAAGAPDVVAVQEADVDQLRPWKPRPDWPQGADVERRERVRHLPFAGEPEVACCVEESPSTIDVEAMAGRQDG